MEQLIIPIDIRLNFYGDRPLPPPYLDRGESLEVARQSFKNDLYQAIDQAVKTRLPQVKSVALVGVPRTGSWELLAGELQLIVRTGLEFLGIYFTLKSFEPIYEPLVDAILSVCGPFLDIAEFTFSAPRTSKNVRTNIAGGSRIYRFDGREVFSRRFVNQRSASLRRHAVIRTFLLMVVPAVAAAMLVYFLKADFRPPSQPGEVDASAERGELEYGQPVTNRIEIHLGQPATDPTIADQPEEASSADVEGDTIRIFKSGREDE